VILGLRSYFSYSIKGRNSVASIVIDRYRYVLGHYIEEELKS